MTFQGTIYTALMHAFLLHSGQLTVTAMGNGMSVIAKRCCTVEDLEPYMYMYMHVAYVY